MPTNFLYGDVTQDTTKIGDKVLYLTSVDRGNANHNYEHFSIAEIIKFTKEKVKVRINDYERHIKEWHLFTLKYFKTKQINLRRKILQIIPDSVRVVHQQNYDYSVVAFCLSKEGYVIIKNFKNKGKLKRAKAFEREFKN